MRTIKDPKKKPEVRRRADYEEEEEDSRSIKSTPPKKRKTTKSSKDDSSSLNDSGSFGDNQSDILSEKSSAYGEDDASDVSSLKGTPPKKRNKVLNKSQEVNGDIRCKADVQEQEYYNKIRGSKRNEKLESTDSKLSNFDTPKRNNGKSVDTEKKGQKGKKKCAKETGTEKPTKVQVKDSAQDLKKSPKTKKAQTSKVVDNKKKLPQENTPSSKKSGTRKRKCSDDEEEEEEMEIPIKQSKNSVKESNKTETTKDKNKTKLTTEKQKTGSPKESTKSTEIQSKGLKKSKKQLKEEATQELKRQTEEQRNAHSVVNKDLETVTLKKKASPKKYNLDNHIPEITVEKGSNKVSADKESNTCLTNETNENVESSHTKITASNITSKDKGDIQVEFPENRTEPENHDCSVLQRDSLENKDRLLVNSNINMPDHAGEEDESSSDLDTSFESINSVHDTSNKVEDHPQSYQGINESLEHKSEEKLESSVCIKCDKCGYVSRSKGGHTRHLRKCQPEQLGLDGESKGPKIHVCEKCEYSAPRRVLVINHMKSHGIYQCKRCQFRTDNEETLDEHSGQEHKDRSDCKFCKLCNRYVKCDQYPLEKHMEECKGRIPFKCPECLKEFQYESSLKCHVVSHYPDQPKLFSCSQCDYKSNYKANLKKHVRHIHEQRGDKTIKCPDCEKLFHTEDNMKRHQKLHSEERPHKCEKEGCEKAFKTLNGLKFHLVSHQTDRPFLCDVEGCNKDFKSKKSLAMHLNETHQNAPKNFHCSVEGCDMAFYKKCHFERHMAAHTGIFMSYFNFLPYIPEL